MTDAGPIVLVDSGEEPDSPDAYVAPDAGDGTCGESISPTGWAELPESCLPRCSHETALALDACTTEACVTAALNADTTPSVLVRTASGVLEVNCAGSRTVYPCIGWQVYACQYEICPDEYGAWIDCLNRGGTCTTEASTLDSCAHGSPEWPGCFQPRASACFAP